MEPQNCTVEQTLLNINVLEINNKYTKTRSEISPSLTIQRTSLTSHHFDPVLVHWANSECCFFIQKIRPKFWSKWRTDESTPVVLSYFHSLFQSEFICLDENVLKTSWRRPLKTKTKGVFKTSSGHFHQNRCLLGYYRRSR